MVEVVVSIAVPLFKVPVPSDMFPLKKVTVPLGTPALEVTAAVKTSPTPTATEADARLRIVAVGTAVAVTIVAGLVEPALFESPAYCADKLCAPGPLRTVDKVALTVVPEVAVPTDAEPIMAVPSKKVTAPVGAAVENVPATVAVSTVFDPACTGEGTTASVVVEGARNGITVTVTLPKEYAAYVESPGYCAVYVCAPAATSVKVRLAIVPLPPSVAVPTIFVPSKN